MVECADPAGLFYRDGYLSPVRVLSEPDATKRRAAFDTLVDEGHYLGHRKARPGEPHVSFKPHMLYTWLDFLAHHEATLDVIEGIIGPDILIWASAIFIKEAHDPAYAAWHQDINYNTLEGREQVSTWLALTPSTRQNGCLRVIPCSHVGGRLPHVETDEGTNYLARHERISGELDESQAVDLELRPGEMSLHHLGTVHGSRPNRTGGRRIGYAVRYIAPNVEPVGQRESAMLARGRDRFGYYELEPRPQADLHPGALAAHRHAVGIRVRNFYA